MGNKENLAQWVTWMRNPEHSQTQSALKDDTGFCCLGGACDMYIDVTGIGEWDDNGVRFTFTSDKAQEDNYLPPEVREFLGLVGVNPYFKVSTDCLYHSELSTAEIEGGYAFVGATSLNDQFDWSFANIADVVQAQLIDADGDGSVGSAEQMTPFRLS